MKRHIPNLLTLGNLICGCIATLFALQGEYSTSFVLLVIALLFDFADGAVARLLKVASPIGKELDSLADMVSFGVFPGMFIYTFLKEGEAIVSTEWYAFLAFFFTACAALRLAKFNIDTRQTYYFRGLPTPAATLFFLALPKLQEVAPALVEPIPLISATIVIGLLMISDIPLLSLKFSSSSFQDNWPKYVLVGLSVLFLLVFQQAGIPLIIITYLLLSLFLKKKIIA